MDTVLLVSEQRMKQWSSLDNNIRIDVLTPSILHAQDIYIQDNERYESFVEAEKIHHFLLKAYKNYGYKVIEVPFDTLTNRMKFIKTSLAHQF